MNNVNRRALDITLAVEARAKYAAMLSAEDRRRICALSSQDELVALLARSDGWRQAVKALPAVGTTEEQFSAALDQELLADFERLYRTASDTSKDFLRFITLERELKAIKAALRRLAAGGAPAAPESALNAPAGTHDQELNRLRDARSFPELVSLCQKSIYGPALRSMQLDKKTGLPVYAEAVLSLGERHEDAVLEAAIPCPEQAEHWSEEHRRRYEALLERCGMLTVVSHSYTPDCMEKRNRYMVEQSSVLLAVYGGGRGGTFNTIRYALKAGLNVLELDV